MASTVSTTLSYHELLKDTGIKTKVGVSIVMNKLINQPSSGFFVSFNLDESFTETIRSRRDDTYSSFSEGEGSYWPGSTVLVETITE